MDITIRVAREEDSERVVEIFDHPRVVTESSQHPFLGFEKIQQYFKKVMITQLY